MNGESVYIGVSSFGDCPLVQGRFFRISVTTGAIESTFNAVPNGCTGVGIWASPALDAAAGTIYLATGNDGGCSSPEPLSEAIVEIRASNLGLLNSWSVPVGARNADSDFGATPILFSVPASHGHATEMVGAVNKNGIFYAFKAGHLRNGPVWEEQISNGGQGPQYGQGDIAPAAWGRTICLRRGWPDSGERRVVWGQCERVESGNRPPGVAGLPREFRPWSAGRRSRRRHNRLW